MTEMAALVHYDADSALVVVDVQNDFAHPDGNLYVAGGEDTIGLINLQVELAQERGAFVVYTQDWHPESTPHFEKDGGTWPTHCVQDTWGAELHQDLQVSGPVVQKGTGGEDGYSGFSVRDPRSDAVEPTALRDLLEQHGVSRLVVVGLAQDVCVKETVLDGCRLGYQVSVLAAATRPVELQPGDGQAALQAMADAGAQILDEQTLLEEHQAHYRGGPSTRDGSGGGGADRY